MFACRLVSIPLLSVILGLGVSQAGTFASSTRGLGAYGNPLELAVVYQDPPDSQEAIEELQKPEYKFDVEAYRKDRQGYNERQLQLYKDFAVKYPGTKQEIEALIQQASILIRLRRRDEGEDLMLGVIAKYDHTRVGARAKLSLAAVWYMSKTEDAITLCEQVVQEFPNTKIAAEAYLMLAELHAYAGDKENIGYFFEQAIKNAPDDAQFQCSCYLSLAYHYQAIKAYEKALQAFRQVESKAVDKAWRASATLGRANVYQSMGDLDKAGQVLNALIQEDPSSSTGVSARMSLSNVQTAQGDYSGAAATIASVIEDVPVGSFEYYNARRAQLESEVEMALSLDDGPERDAAFGQVYNDHIAYIDELWAATEDTMNPGRATRVEYRLADFCYRMDRFELAESWFKTVLNREQLDETHGGREQAHIALAAVLYSQGPDRYAEALELIEQGMRLSAQHDNVWMELLNDWRMALEKRIRRLGRSRSGIGLTSSHLKTTITSSERSESNTVKIVTSTEGVEGSR